MVYAGIMGGGGGGLWPRWLEHTVQRALVHDFKGPGFLANSWYGSSPTPLSLQLVCPPLFGTKGGGGGQHSHAGEGGEPIRTTGEKAWHSVYSACP
jgi:hypothetical protein